MSTAERPAIIDLVAEPLTSEAFAPFGTVIAPGPDDAEFGPRDASLVLGNGTPRFYAMRLPARSLVVERITRHRRVTQVLASAGGDPWLIAVAAPDAASDCPEAGAIRAFRIPPDTAIALHVGTWHAGPLFVGEDQSFFNLELADTNVVDHDTAEVAQRTGIAIRVVDDAS